MSTCSMNNSSPGEAGFVQALGSGTTIEQVKALMLGSPEYFQRAGSTNLAFLQALYHAVLNRALDPAGQSGWSAALAQEEPPQSPPSSSPAPKPSKTWYKPAIASTCTAPPTPPAWPPG
jgi:hypothetical protein